MRQQGDKDPRDPRTRTEAARTLLDARGNKPEEEMAAFMEIFHPGHQLTVDLVRDAKAKR